MNDGCCRATERYFSEENAREDLLRYQRKGPDSTTRILLEMLKDRDLQGTTVLDVGGGIGALSCELLAEGVEHATLVEIASAYIDVAEAEAKSRGLFERMTFVHGDFVASAEHLPQADLVTLDRVVCCYPDLERLVTSSAAKARQWYALSHPRDRWYVRLGTVFENWQQRLRGHSFRTYVHPEAHLHELLLAAGFVRSVNRKTLIWQVSLYDRTGVA